MEKHLMDYLIGKVFVLWKITLWINQSRRFVFNGKTLYGLPNPEGFCFMENYLMDY